jgi:hypothetical protein
MARSKSIRIALLAAVALLSSLRSVGAFSAPEMLYEDNFERFDPGWGEASELVSVKDGKMVIRPKLGTSQAVQHQGIVVEDGVISVALKVVKDDGRIQAAGLIFWGADYQNYYVVDITPDGRYAVTRWLKGRWLYPVSYRKSDAIRKDYNQDNEIRVMTKGSLASVYINGTEVTTLRGQPPKGGGLIGLYAESGLGEPTHAEFVHLKVTALP